jgi:hypothetical protein
MTPARHLITPLLRTSLSVAGVALVLLTGACGDDDNAGQAAPSPIASANTPEAKGAPGSLTVESSSPIVGQQGKQLAIFATARNGASPMARACVRISSDSFAVPATLLTEIGTNQDACSTTTTAVFPKGSYTIVAGIYIPPSSVLEKQTALTVEVSSDAPMTVKIDGAALSR